MAVYDFKSVGDKVDSRKYTEVLDPSPIGIKTPLEFGTSRSGLLEMHFTNAGQIKDNFRNLVQTNFGERVGLYSFGANLIELVGELASKEDFDSEAMLRIKNAATRWMPFVELETFESTFVDPADTASGLAHIVMTITYSVVKLSIIKDQIQVTVIAMG
jgi:phage baseplate assembly protein W